MSGGMKEGAGEDPFATDDDEEVDTNNTDSPNSAPEPTTSTDPNDSQQPGREMKIPYVLRRDSVQEGRDRVPLFLQSGTKRTEREIRRDLEDRFNEDVSLTDLREALVRVGAQHIDEVEDQLHEWGYGVTFTD